VSLKRLLAALLFASALSLAAPPVKLDGLDAAEFDKLAPGSLLDVGGRTLTKAQLLAELAALKSPGSAPAAASADSVRAHLAADEKASVDASNTSVRSAWKSIEADKTAAAAAASGGPRITSVEGQPVREGGDLLIRGSGFGGGGSGLGAHPGEVHLLGPFPGGHVSLQVCIGGGFAGHDIYGCDFRPHAIYVYAKGGPSFAGLKDQQLQIVVVTRTGERSPPFPVAFRAKRVLQELGPHDVSVVRSNPAEGPCVGSADVTITCTEGKTHGRVWHIGVDGVTATLKNGWTFDSNSSTHISGYGLPLGHDPMGGMTGRIIYSADLTKADATCTYTSLGMALSCEVRLYAKGPDGVPWK
jgi:hypothetical protein